MPGYYLHLAACGGELLKNKSFVLGVEAPDILKKHLKDAGGDIEKARAKYNFLRFGDMPDYSDFEVRVQQKESRGKLDGMHYGKSSSTNVRVFWNSLSEAQKKTAFYRGYAWHLLTDAIMYARLDIDARFAKVLGDNLYDEELRWKEVEKLHLDWDKTNTLVRATYPEVILTPEVEELNVVGFEAGKPIYVDWNILKETIDFLRTFDPLTGDMEAIIEEILHKSGR